MKGFALGIVLGLALGGGGVWLLTRPGKAKPAEEVALGEPTPPTTTPGKKKKGKGGGRSASREEPAEASAPIVLGAADLAQASEGDALKVPPQTMDLAPGAEEPRALSPGEIEAAIAPHADSIGACIERAAGDAEITGKVTAGVVVSAEGRVTRTRVEAPKYLLGRGLGGCVRGVLRGLDFPATGKATVLRYPFHVS